MSVLFRRSKIFIDLKSLLAYTDLYVIERLFEMSYEQNLDLSIFTTLKKEVNTIGFDQMRYKLQEKKFINVLYGYLDFDVVCKGERDPYEFCRELYNSLLYQEYDFYAPNSPVLELTPLADSIQLIATDVNTDSIYIYMEEECRYLQQILDSFMGSSKIQYVSGDKKEFLTNNTFDSYFFESIDDISYISRRHPNKSEVIVPAFPFNASGYEFDDETGEPRYSQDSLHKIPALPENPMKYEKEYNLTIALIDVPL